MGVTQAGSHFFLNTRFLFSFPHPQRLLWVWLDSGIYIFRRFPGDSDKFSLWPTGTLTFRQRNICLDVLGVQASGWHKVWGTKPFCVLRAFPYALTLSYMGYLLYKVMLVSMQRASPVRVNSLVVLWWPDYVEPIFTNRLFTLLKQPYKTS